MIASSLLVVGLITTAAVLESDDASGLIENGPILATIDDECAVMTDQVDQLGSAGQPDDLAETIRDQNEAVTTMVEQIRLLPRAVLAQDRPTEAWLRDWDRLVTARESYAKALEANGEPAGRFEVPLDPDGLPIDLRMEDALLDDVCRVPESLVDPDRRGRSSV
jgi:hypothetical protein